MIKRQDYKNIKEWVIVEGSPEEELAGVNCIEIKKVVENFHIPVVYVEYTEKKPFSEIYNSGNNACSGDIIVIMEDDDYYPPCRVSHAVEELEKSEKLIAGCSGIFMYCYSTDKFYKFKPFNCNHSCNHAFAYKRQYLENHHFENNNFNIESSFTNEFTEPMVQLDPNKTIVLSIHSENTVKKDTELIQHWLIYSVIKITKKGILSYIPEDIFFNMKNVLVS